MFYQISQFWFLGFVFLLPTCVNQGKWKHSDSDQKTQEGDRWRVKMEEQGKTGEEEEIESPPSINLDLGIGWPTTSSSEPDHRLKNRPNNTVRRVVKVEDQVVVEERESGSEREKRRGSRKASVACFTEEQLYELNTQLQILGYMVSGLPIPLHLLLPICRCFSSSLSPLFRDLQRRNPFSLGLSSWGFDKRYLMDLEPGRCRRTDGKKWRCHKPVIPNEKYCEGHMHRGSKRSRKLVESSTQASLNPESIKLMSSNPKKTLANDLKIKFPANLDQKPQLPTPKNPLSRCNSNSVVGGSSEANYGPTRVVIRVPSLTNSAKSNENNKQNYAEVHNNFMKERIAAMRLSSRLDFSPKSVLQSGQKCPRAEAPKTGTNAEVGRCRRTDGKKWRCHKNVLPDQKYCAQHINRGTKRSAVALPASGEAELPASGAKLTGPQEAKMKTLPSTSLNVFLTIGSGDPRNYTPEDSTVACNGESGSTTETTITDDSADISDMIVLSP